MKQELNKTERVLIKLEKTVFISGASKGIGLATALLLAKNGFRVFGTTRDIEALEAKPNQTFKKQPNLDFIEMDVNDDSSVKAAVAKVTTAVPSIDVLINNAGFGTVGSAEDIGVEGAYRQFETNYFGVIRLTNEFLPIMRKAGKGLIINVSSMASLFTVPFQGQYVASKKALEGYSESLRAELKPFGIRVALILPNDIKTEVNKGRVAYIPPNSIYADNVGRVNEIINSNVDHAASPNIIANSILGIINTANPRMRYYAELNSRFLSLLKRILPDKTVLALVNKRYGL